MFEINLHRQALEQRRRAHKRRVKILLVRVIYVAALALLTGVFTLHLLLLHQSISAKEEELRKIEQILVSYGPMDAGISADKVAVVSWLKGGQPRWNTKLKVLCSLLPSQVWLTEIFLTKKRIDGIQKDVLQVSGSTHLREGHEGLDVILEFLNALRDDEGFSEDFESVELLSSERSRSLEKKELNFKFVCPIRKRGSWERDFSG